VRLHVLSDLHLEIRPLDPPAADADVVVLAGDIDNGVRGLEWARSAFAGHRVVYVPGNHEYYLGDMAETARSLRAYATHAGIELLDCDTTVIGGVRILGCTLWTDYSLAAPAERPEVIERSRRYNPDHSMIHVGDRPFAPEDAVALCARSRAWLARSLAEPFDGRTVVITHFAPHVGSIAPAFDRHPANPGFIVPLPDLMGRASLWIHGHTHTAFDYEVSGTRVVCNPRGYPDEGTGFRDDFVVDLG
jgi:predicted phosphodiesterase